MIADKELKREIKILRKTIKDLKAEKLLLPSGNKKRIELHRKIKELKQELKNKKEVRKNNNIETKKLDNIKDPIIAEILKKDILLTKLNIDLKKYSVKDLQKHLALITEKKGK